MCNCNSCSTCKSKPKNCDHCVKNRCSGPCQRQSSFQLTSMNCGSCGMFACVCPSKCPDPCGKKIQPRYFECDFPSLITPLNNLIPTSGILGTVDFLQTVSGRIVNLQWEPFTAQIGANGVSFLTIQQTIQYPPPYTLWRPIAFEYKGVPRMGYFYISPNNVTIQARIYLNEDGSATGINLGDAIRMPSNNITWTI